MTREGVVVCEELKISSNPRLQKSPAPKSFAEEEKKKKNKRRACNSDFNAIQSSPAPAALLIA